MRRWFVLERPRRDTNGGSHARRGDGDDDDVDDDVGGEGWVLSKYRVAT